MAYYCTDAQVTDWLPSNLTDSVIETESQRNAKLRTPAKMWIDSVYPNDSPFAGITDNPDTPDIIQQASAYYAAGLGFMVLSRNPDDGDANVMMKLAVDLLQIDPETGLARAQVSGITSTARASILDLTRSRDDEDRDEDINQRALYP